MIVLEGKVFSREEVVKDFFKCVDKIKSEDIKDMVNVMLKEAPDEFWHSKGSNSGRNHPPENNLEDVGLMIHIVKAVQIAEDSFRFFNVQTDYEEDMILAAVILHDLYKYGDPWDDKYEKDHGLICAEKLEKFDEIHPYILHKIQSCIETHMSRWTHPLTSMKNFILPEKTQLIVALADYYSSRNQISFYPGLSIIGGKNEQRQES